MTDKKRKGPSDYLSGFFAGMLFASLLSMLLDVMLQ